jgi:hypothetical protein
MSQTSLDSATKEDVGRTVADEGYHGLSGECLGIGCITERGIAEFVRSRTPLFVHEHTLATQSMCML